MDTKQLRDFLSENSIETVIAAGTDPIGVFRGKRLTIPYFLEIADKGISFSSFLLTTTTMDEVLPGVFDTGVPDVRGKPDLGTLRVAGWEANTAVVLMDWLAPDGSPSPLCPRSELKRQREQLRGKGLEEIFAMEFEFFLLPRPIGEIRAGNWSALDPGSVDIHCYSVYEGHFWEDIVSRLRTCFREEIEGCLPEWGPGQFEINLKRSDALSMADTTMLFKTAVKQVAAQSGASATFMAKWHNEHAGNSGHIHQSLFRADGGESAFFDESDPNAMSDLFRQYVAGQLDVFRPATLFYAPFVNSYKRFEPDSFAGVMRSWGIDNRTVAMRVMNEGRSSTRMEHRIGGADLNPYTAFATCLGAGLRGIEKRLDPGPPAEGNAYQSPEYETVPTSLEEAMHETEGSSEIREVLGEAFIDNILRISRFEVGVHKGAVTDMDRRRYFEMA